jgi:antitoxin component YwqK of YwqJK toxin-antitoxin module
MTKNKKTIKHRFYLNGNVESKEYYKNGVLHRDGDLPAVINYRKNGIVNYKHYYDDGKLNRDGDLPAVLTYHPEGTLAYEGYYKNWLMHRDGGLPSGITYTIDGQISHKIYYINGKCMSDEIVKEFETFKSLYSYDPTIILLNSKHKNLIIQNYCQKLLYDKR